MRGIARSGDRGAPMRRDWAEVGKGSPTQANYTGMKFIAAWGKSS